MPNIWHIWHTKHQNTPNIRCSKSHNFCNMVQYPYIFGTVRTSVAYGFIIFLFLFLSHPNYLFCLLLQLFTASISTLPYSFFFLLPSSLLLYSLPIHESWATTDFLSTISQIPSSLIYKISFTSFFFLIFYSPFVRSLLSVLSQSHRFAVLRVADFLSTISQIPLFFPFISESPIRCLISVSSIHCSISVSPILWRFHWFTDSLKVSSIHCFSEGFIDSFYIYCVQVSSPSSLWFSRYFGVYFYSLYLLSSYVLCAVLCICFINSSI